MMDSGNDDDIIYDAPEQGGNIIKGS
jgi:hypothetical protein